MITWLRGLPQLNWTEKRIALIIRAVCLAASASFMYLTGVGSIFDDSSAVDASDYLEEDERVDDSRSQAVGFKELERIFGSAPREEHSENSVLVPLRVASICKECTTDYGSVITISILEDMRTGSQDVFEKGDEVFGIGNISNIYKEYVIIQSKGRSYRIFLDREFKSEVDQIGVPSNKESDDIREISFRSFEIKEKFLEKVTRDLMTHLGKGYSRSVEGGLLVYGLDRDSVFRKIGIMDSDLITHVNGNPVSSLGLIGEVLEYISSGNLAGETVSIGVQRAGMDISLKYTVVK